MSIKDGAYFWTPLLCCRVQHSNSLQIQRARKPIWNPSKFFKPCTCVVPLATHIGGRAPSSASASTVSSWGHGSHPMAWLDQPWGSHFHARRWGKNISWSSFLVKATKIIFNIYAKRHWWSCWCGCHWLIGYFLVLYDKDTS